MKKNEMAVSHTGLPEVTQNQQGSGLSDVSLGGPLPGSGTVEEMPSLGGLRP